jgi:preprotein translocase subunit SecB
MKGTPKILKIDFEVNKKFDFKKVKSLKLDLDISHTTKINKEQNEALVELDIIIFPKENESPFTCKTKTIAQFVWGEGTPEETVEKLLKTNAPALILSFVRPIISQITTYSGQPTFVIPLLDLSKN